MSNPFEPTERDRECFNCGVTYRMRMRRCTNARCRSERTVNVFLAIAIIDALKAGTLEVSDEPRLLRH